MTDSATLSNLGVYHRYYQADKPVKPFSSFNIWVLLFGPAWFFYRNMFGIGLIWLFLELLVTQLIALSPLCPVYVDDNFFTCFTVACNVVMSLVANWLYIKQVEKWVANNTPIKYGFKYGLIGILILLASIAVTVNLARFTAPFKTQQIESMVNTPSTIGTHIFKNGIIDKNLTDEKGVSLVQNAVMTNAHGRLLNLANAGADLEKPNHLGFTPLYMATLKANIETMKILLNHGAKVNALSYYDNHGDTTAQSALIVAVGKSNAEAANFLIANGADIDMVYDFDKDTKGTALMFVAFQGDLAMVKLLVEHGAKLDQALQVAQEMKHADIAQYLIAHGAT